MNKKTKLLIGITEFDMSGAPKLVADEINNFNKNKYELALLTFFQSSDGNDFFNLLPGGMKIYRLNFKDFRDIKNWFKAYKILREYKPDIVLSHLFFSNTVLRTLKPFFRYRIIIYEHNTYVNKKRWQILADKILSYFTHKIIADSETVKNFTVRQEKISSGKFIVIPCSINYRQIMASIAEYDKDILKQKLGFKKEDKIIINVAKLWPQKNQELLIESFAEFDKKNSGYKLIILGDGPRHNFLNECIKNLNLEEKILLLGRKKNVFEYMFISEFFILTSKIEGFPIASLEAMAVGLPIISTNVAGLDACIKDDFNGYLVKSEDKKEIAQAMQKTVDRGKDYFSDNCRKTAENYDIKKHVDKLEALI